MKIPKLNKSHMAQIGGAVLLFVVAAFFIIGSDRQAPDLGGVANSRVTGTAPVAKNDAMQAVSQDEASKRATVNAEAAARAQGRNQAYVAQPVIVATEPPRQPEQPPAPPTAVPPPAAPQPQRPAPAAPAQAAANSAIYAYALPVDEAAARSKIESQIEQVIKPPSGSFSVRTYGRPETAAVDGSAQTGGGGLTRQQTAQAAVSNILAARAGDMAYATLDRGFNSVDPSGFIFATIFDFRDNGTTGPLHGARLLGQITFNRDQAAVTFATLILPSGYQTPVKALGVRETDGRTGIAGNVDYHTFERYSGLLVAGLIQGAGQVGQQLVQTNQNYTILPSGAVVVQSNPVNLGQAALAAVQPVGTALSSAAAGQFNKAPTISAPAAMGLGVVFLEPLQLPIAQVQQSKALIRAGDQQR